MDKVFELQERVQQLMAEFNDNMDHNTVFGNKTTVGETYDYVIQLKFFIEEEITELLESLGDGSRDIHKPWKGTYESLRDQAFVSTDKTKEEAIDMLCFAINVCIAVGVDHTNINDEYFKVFKKILSRLEIDHE